MYKLTVGNSGAAENDLVRLIPATYDALLLSKIEDGIVDTAQVVSRLVRVPAGTHHDLLAPNDQS